MNNFEYLILILNNFDVYNCYFSFGLMMLEKLDNTRKLYYGPIQKHLSIYYSYKYKLAF
jgi:hypothetical protein